MKILNIDGMQLPVDVEGYHAVLKDGVLYEVLAGAHILLSMSVASHTAKWEFIDGSIITAKFYPALYQPLSSLPIMDDFEVIVTNPTVFAPTIAQVWQVRGGNPNYLWCLVPKMRGM